MQKKSVKILAQISMLIALSLVIKLTLDQVLNIFGAMMRLNASLVISQLVPILFGPLLGAISNVTIALLAFFIRPQGAWLWHITVIEIFCGLLLGFLWLKISIKNRLAKLTLAILITDIIYTTLNTWGLLLFIPSMQGAPFMAMYIPRLVFALCVAIPKISIMLLLLKIHDKHVKKDVETA
jgi:ECF transporter S component (folate family)